MPSLEKLKAELEGRLTAILVVLGAVPLIGGIWLLSVACSEPSPTVVPLPSALPSSPVPVLPPSPVPVLPQIAHPLHDDLILYSYLDYVSRYAPRHGPSEGYVRGFGGHDCHYVQAATIESAPSYFYDVFKGSVTIMIFDDDICMSYASHIGESSPRLDNIAIAFAQEQVNLAISRWYSVPDANFMYKPNDLKGAAEFQVKGWCIQSQTYPIQSFAVDYFTKGSGLGAVLHSTTIGGCE